jgi:hypothetical protein
MSAFSRPHLATLRDAARVGIADVEAGRFTTFDEPAELERHTKALAEEALTEAEGRTHGR